MSKYQLREPIEAIQYTGDNLTEVFEFCLKYGIQFEYDGSTSPKINGERIDMGVFLIESYQWKACISKDYHSAMFQPVPEGQDD